MLHRKYILIVDKFRYLMHMHRKYNSALTCRSRSKALYNKIKVVIYLTEKATLNKCVIWLDLKF